MIKLPKKSKGKTIRQTENDRKYRKRKRKKIDTWDKEGRQGKKER